MLLFQPEIGQMSDTDDTIKLLLVEYPSILRSEKGHFKSQGPGSNAQRPIRLFKPEPAKKEVHHEVEDAS